MKEWYLLNIDTSLSPLDYFYLFLNDFLISLYCSLLLLHNLRGHTCFTESCTCRTVMRKPWDCMLIIVQTSEKRSRGRRCCCKWRPPTVLLKHSTVQNSTAQTKPGHGNCAGTRSRWINVPEWQVNVRKRIIYCKHRDLKPLFPVYCTVQQISLSTRLTQFKLGTKGTNTGRQ